MEVKPYSWTIAKYLRQPRGEADVLRKDVLVRAKTYRYVDSVTLDTQRDVQMFDGYDASLNKFWGAENIVFSAELFAGRTASRLALKNAPENTIFLPEFSPGDSVIGIHCVGGIDPLKAFESNLSSSSAWEGYKRNLLPNFQKVTLKAPALTPDLIGAYINTMGLLSLVFSSATVTESLMTHAAAFSGFWYGINKVDLEINIY